MAEVTLTFLGDMMCQMQQIHAVRKAHVEYSVAFDKIRHVLASSDFVVGNLETPVAGAKARYAFEETRFNAPDEFLDSIRNLGVDFVSTANNHCMDRGVCGIDETIRKLDKLNIGHTGTYLREEDADAPCVVDVRGVRVGLVSCTFEMNQGRRSDLLPEGFAWKVDQLAPPKDFDTTLSFAVRRFIKNCIPYGLKVRLKRFKQGCRPAVGGALADSAPESAIGCEAHRQYRERIAAKIKKVRQLSDVVVVLPHIGGQYNAEPGPFQKWTARWMAEAGADLIICNHAHTTLQTERLDSGAFVAYALGNFSLTPGVGYYRQNCQADNSVVLNMVYDSEKRAFVRKYFYVTVNALREDGISEVTLAPSESEDTKAVVRRFSGGEIESVADGKYMF